MRWKVRDLDQQNAKISYDGRRNFSLNGQTVMLIANLRKMTDAPTVAETVRQSIILMNIVSRQLKEGRQLVLDYKTRSSETITDKYQGIHTTRETKKGLAINRKNVCMTSSTNTLLAETIEITGFKTDSALINYAVRLYYAVLSVLIDGGRVSIRFPDDTYRDLIIIANWRKSEVQD